MPGKTELVHSDWLGDWQIALAMTCALRIIWSAAAAVFSFVLHPPQASIRTNALTQNLAAPGNWHYSLLGVWERFDTLWYLHVAQHGYDVPMAVIFYPLYPATIRALSAVFAPVLAALLISTIAAFFFFWGLLRLAAPGVAGLGRVKMLGLLAVWPTSFVLFAGYAESLTLAFIVWAIVFAREDHWWPASFCGLLAGLGRPSGVLVFVPLLVMAVRRRQLRTLAVLLTPAGLLGYWAWLWWSGREAVVEAYRSYQGMTLAPPWSGLAEAIKLILTNGDVLLAIKLALIILVLLLSLRREVPIEDKLFSLAIILQMLIYTGRPLLGAPRYLLAVYPAFIVLGRKAESWSTRQLAFYVVGFGIMNLAWMKAFLNWSLVF